jgi:hypothetical protein
LKADAKASQEAGFEIGVLPEGLGAVLVNLIEDCSRGLGGLAGGDQGFPGIEVAGLVFDGGLAGLDGGRQFAAFQVLRPEERVNA